jgi:hypothetical protein
MLSDTPDENYKEIYSQPVIILHLLEIPGFWGWCSAHFGCAATKFGWKLIILAGPKLDALGKFRTVAHLEIKPPQQDTGRGRLDQAIRPEGDQGQAARGYPDPIATDASISIHPAVIHSRRKARRTRSGRDTPGRWDIEITASVSAALWRPRPSENVFHDGMGYWAWSSLRAA